MVATVLGNIAAYSVPALIIGWPLFLSYQFKRNPDWFRWH